MRVLQFPCAEHGAERLSPVDPALAGESRTCILHEGTRNTRDRSRITRTLQTGVLIKILFGRSHSQLKFIFILSFYKYKINELV